jgi:hypothetical protein
MVLGGRNWVEGTGLTCICLASASGGDGLDEILGR